MSMPCTIPAPAPYVRASWGRFERFLARCLGRSPTSDALTRALRAFARWIWAEGFTAEHRLKELRLP